MRAENLALKAEVFRQPREAAGEEPTAIGVAVAGAVAAFAAPPNKRRRGAKAA
jgi:hypothetical protein